MSRFSILPPYLTIVETWIIRLFVRQPPPLFSIHSGVFRASASLTAFSFQLLLALITIGPFILFILADMLLYTIRAILYEIPFVGGRARGKRRPRRPTLSESRKRGRAWSFGGGGIPEGLRRHGSWQSDGVVVVDEVAGANGEEEEEVLIVRRRKRRGSGDGKEGEGVQAGEADGKEGEGVDEGVQAGEADADEDIWKER